MKKTFAVLLCLLVILTAFAACGEKKPSLKDQEGFSELTPEEDQSLADLIDGTPFDDAQP